MRRLGEDGGVRRGAGHRGVADEPRELAGLLVCRHHSGSRSSPAASHASQGSQDARGGLRWASLVDEAEQVVEVDVHVARELAGKRCAESGAQQDVAPPGRDVVRDAAPVFEAPFHGHPVSAITPTLCSSTNSALCAHARSTRQGRRGGAACRAGRRRARRALAASRSDRAEPGTAGEDERDCHTSSRALGDRRLTS